MSRRVPNTMARYGVALVCVLLTIGLRQALDPIIGVQFPFATLAFGVLVSAWYGGFGPALLALALAALASGFLFLPPRGSWQLEGAGQATGVLLVLATGVGIAWLGGLMHRAHALAHSAAELLEHRVAERTEELAQANDRLMASEARARRIVEGVRTHAIVTLDLDGLITSWNPGAARLSGYDADDVIGRHISLLYTAADRAQGKPQSHLQLARSLGIAYDDGPRVRSDGSEFWAAVSTTPLLDDNQKSSGFVEVVRDFSDDIESMKLLRDKQAALEEAQRLAHIGNWSWNASTRITTGSDEFYRIFGFDPATERLSTLDELRGGRYAEEEWDRLNAVIQNALETGVGYTLDLRANRHGEAIWVTARAEIVRNDAGETIGLRGTLQDITERRRVEEALRVERDRIAGIIATVPVVICSFRRDADGLSTLPFASPGIVPLFGIATAELERDASRLFQQIHPDDIDQVNAALEASAQTMTAYQCEFRVQTPAQGERWLDTHAIPQAESDGSVRWHGYVADITTRKQQEEALRERERLLGIVTSTARVGLVVVDTHYRYLFANQAYAEIFGLESAQIVGRTVPEILVSAWSQIQPRLDRALAGERVEYELTLPQVNGLSGTRYYAVVYEPRRNHDGGHSVVVVVVDVTERRSAEESARESEQRLRFAQQVARIGAFDRNLDTDEIRWTPELERLYGLEPAARPRTRADIRALIHPEDRAVADAGVARAFATGLPTEAEWRTIWPDGSTHWLAARFQVVPDGDGRASRLIGVNIDITDVRRAEAATREHRQRLEGIVNSAMDGIITIDEDQRIVVFNAAAERMFGCSAQDAMGGSIERFLPARIRAQHAGHMQRFGQTGVSARPMGRFGPISGMRSDGVEFPIDASISIVRVEGHTLYTVTCRDVTERMQSEEARRSLEAQLRQSQKMEAFGQLAGGVAHDFNNLLTVITGCSELILQTSELADDQAAMISEIHGAGERASALTRQLLAFSRQQMLELKVVDLNAVIGDIERLLHRLIGEDISLTTVLRPGISTVRVDPRQIEQVIMNLAVNARDAMPRGGRLTIETSDMVLGDDVAATYPDARPGRYVKLTIADSGSGMTEEVRSRVFEPFFTTKAVGKGTGLGLAVVHGIVKQSDGAIAVASEVNAGTTFTIMLPAVNAPDGARRTDVRMHMPLGTETILLVEDEIGVRELAARVLHKCGYRVMTATSGDDAQKLASDYPAPIDLLVTDVVMPGTGGHIAAENLRAARPGLKVLFMSGYADDALTRHGVEQAQVAFLQKPFSPSSLARKVRDTLDGIVSD